MAHHFPKYLDLILEGPEAAAALSTSEQTLTYGELRALAGAISARIDVMNLPRGSRIGISMERGLLPPISLLACLLSGHTYVPLDPGYPRERLARMVDIADLNVLLCDYGTAELFAHNQKIELSLDDLLDAPVVDTGALWTASATAAYVIFTSGSTGTPKAVTMPHEALANLLEWQSRDARFDCPARTLQFTPISFDVHFQELFHTWSTHGEVCVVKDADRRDPLLLLRLIQERRIERLYLPFVALSQLTEAGVTNGLYPDSLKEIVTAGEQLVVQPKVRQFFSALHNARLHNQYGPSETHVVTSHTLDGVPEDWPELPAIGTAIDNVWLEVLDEQGAPVAVGQPGELYVGGLCLAEGYFGAQTLTAERFLQRPQGRAYRTGDLARCDHGGCFSYLGRVDEQLKIRGHRVEPGEVEAAIAEDVAVAACAVAGRMISVDEQALMAYVVAQPEQPTGSSAPAEALEVWQAVWDGTYSADADALEPTFDLRGWNSSFTGKQLARADMRQWVDQTRQRILAACPAPSRILELGCGTGLFAFALAADCEEYVATDYSAVTVAQLQERLHAQSDLYSHIRSQQLSAEQAHTLGEARFDTVVVNSLTQHFVSYEYLLLVVESALQALTPTGVLFFGDITSKNTRELYYTAVEAFKMPADATGDQLLDQVSTRLCTERELLIEPWMWFRLAERFPQIQQVHIQLKGAGYDNELADYRYDVVLRCGTALDNSDPGTLVHADWNEIGDAQGASQWLAGQRALVAGEYRWLTGVPNARVTRQAALLRLASDHGELSLTDLHTRADAICQEHPGVDPAVFEELASRVPNVKVQTFHADSAPHFDVLLMHVENGTGSIASDLKRGGVQKADQDSRSLHSYTSNPINMAAFGALEVRLRAQLDRQLPEYMLPSRYVPLSMLPLTPSGKIDRAKLPAPATTRPPLGEPFVEPAGSMQERMAGIWRSRLMLDQVGANDNFFDLGGSSLQSLKLCTDMAEALQRPVPIVALFQYPTIAALSEHLAQADDSGHSASPARQARRKNSSTRQHQAVAAHRARARQRKQ